MLRVRVLGNPELETEGRRLPPPARRPARALLGWLALHPGLHARSTVAGRLWPDVLEASARASLRTALSALRSALGPAADGALLASREHVGLAPDVWVDVREFERLHVQGRAREALELCRGELLAGLDDDWVLGARDEQRTREGDVLRALADAAAAAGDHDTAVGLARRRAALDPLDEAAHRDLMCRLAAAGDRGAALTAYERLAERMRRALGVPPSPATRALATDLRGNGAAARASARPGRGERPELPARLAAARRRGPLVGREAPRAQLRALWARSAREGRHLALVTGEPGIGKTRLVAELAAELCGEGAEILYGRVDEDPLVPYQPLAEALREPLRRVGTLPSDVGELAGLFPEAARPDAPDRAAIAAEPAPGARLRLFEAVGAALDAVSARRPLLLVLDDLHWAEQSTIRLIVHLAGRPTGAPRLVAATYRDTELDQRHPLAAGLADLHRELPVERIALEGLDRDGVAAMIERWRGGDPHPAAVRALREQTGGNPFFIEQLLRPAVTEPGEGRPASRPLAAGAVEAVSRRVAALGPEAYAVLAAGAIAGLEFELAVVAEALGLTVDAALDVLDAAVRARLLVEVPGEPGSYAFAHALVRDALLEPLTAARRARLHERIAGALEARVDAAPDRYVAALASHALEGGGDPERAAVLAERAAARADAVLAHEDAAELLRRALSLLERRAGPVGRRAELLCALGETLQRAGATEPARAALERASELARSAGRSELLARAALGAGGVGVTILGVDPQLVSRLDEALDTLGPDGDPALRVRLLARLAIELAYDADPSRREHASDEALQLARRLGDPGPLATALSARHVALWGPDHTDARLRLAGEMLELAQRAGDQELALQARNWRVVDLMEAGDGPAVRAELDAYAALAAQARLPAYSWYVPMWRATLALIEGRIADGLDLSRRARDLGRRAGDANADVFYTEHQLLRLLVEDRIADVTPHTTALAGAVAERADHGPAWRAYQLTFAWAHAERGDLDEARRLLDAALAGGPAKLPRDINWLSALSSAAEACVLLGDRERARELRALLEPYADRMVVNARGACHAGSVAFVLARLATACGDQAAADELFEEAARRDDHADAPTLVIRDLRHHAELLLATGQDERAQKILDRATRASDELRRISCSRPRPTTAGDLDPRGEPLAGTESVRKTTGIEPHRPAFGA